MFAKVAILLLLYWINIKKYTFNSTVNDEIMSKMFETIYKSNFFAKYLKENAYRTI